MSHPGSNPQHEAHDGYEKRDVTFRPIVVASVVLVAVLVFTFVLVRATLTAFSTQIAETGPRANPLASAFGRQVPPEPRLQTHPVQDLAVMRADEEAFLNRYGWIDQAQGVVHLPIERAMDLVVQRGLPARATAEAGR